MKKRRILLALIMLIISGISLTTATYAWFTANYAVKVDQIDISASASGGIQISADAKTWSNQVTLAQLQAEATTNIPTGSLKPVTTVGSLTTGKFDFLLGELDGTGSKVKLTEIADNAGHYVAFDLYFYSAQPVTIGFNDGTSVTAKDSSNDKQLDKSVRVGFLHQGLDATATEATAKALANGTKDNQIIWEPNSDQHTAFAVSQLGAVNDTTPTYMGGKAASTDYVNINNSTYFETIDSTNHKLITSTVEDVYPLNNLWEFAAGINKVRVYIWIEGQDIDNEDTASLGAGVSINLNFIMTDHRA